MRILLINSPIRLEANPNCIPYGLATVAATLRNQGFHVEIYDANALRPSESELLEALEGKQWDVVGISGLITTYRFQKWLIPRLKAMRPEAVTVSGGGLATSSSDLLFRHTAVDVVVLGEGEQTMPELCRGLETGMDLGQVRGIRFRKDGGILSTATRENAPDLDQIPFPAWDLLPMEIYLKHPIWGDVANNSSGFRKDISVKRSMNIISSRGCPFSCNYCYHLFGRSSYRLRSALNVVEEIELLVDKYGVDFIGFVDDNMMGSEKRLLTFCDLMEAKRFALTWGCHGRVSSARPEILQRMAEAGCVWIGYGIESGSQKILDAMNKKTTVARAREAIADTRKAGIYANTTFIFGYPGENTETIQETIDFKRDLNIESRSFFATPYPGTPLYEQISAEIEDEEGFVLSLNNATDFSINLTRYQGETLFALKKAMDENRDVIPQQAGLSEMKSCALIGGLNLDYRQA
jgi:radical SAM superfamily enzyme YgiQ (UPF0313 family)